MLVLDESTLEGIDCTKMQWLLFSCNIYVMLWNKNRNTTNISLICHQKHIYHLHHRQLLWQSWTSEDIHSWHCIPSVKIKVHLTIIFPYTLYNSLWRIWVLVETRFSEMIKEHVICGRVATYPTSIQRNIISESHATCASKNVNQFCTHNYSDVYSCFYYCF